MNYISSYNPSTQEILGQVVEHEAPTIFKFVKAAKEYSPDFAKLTFKERQQILMNFKHCVLKDIDEWAALISAENGKPRIEALGNDLLPGLDFVECYAKNTAKWLKPQKINLGKWGILGHRSHLEFYPYGVVAIISPWNFPFSIPVGQIALALMAGNTVVFKPSEFTPLVGVRICEYFKRAGLPQSALTLITGGAKAGEALIQSDVDKIVFTGSVATGKKIMQAASAQLKPLTLELGGKDPLIVFEDADLDVASSAAVWGGFCNSGQVCASVERVYVHESVAQTFTDLVVSKTNKLRQGDGKRTDVDIGAITTPFQFQKIVAQVHQAKNEGAQILCGGEVQNQKGLFYPPTVIVNVSQTSALIQEETFGPILPILTFKTDEEAITLANDSIFALNAYVWTKNIKRAKKIASQIKAGTVNINDSVFSFAMPQAPWGGPKQSGVGHTHGRVGLMNLVCTRHVHRNLMPFKQSFFWWYGYSEKKYQMLKNLSVVLFGKGFKRVTSFLKFVKNSVQAKVD